jgi:sulfatase modifying factor 1
MAGNASEWCRDWYDRHFGVANVQFPELEDPQGPTHGEKRVVRGGSFDSGVSAMRASHRAEREPDRLGGPAPRSYSTIGFRVAFSSKGR